MKCNLCNKEAQVSFKLKGQTCHECVAKCTYEPAANCIPRSELPRLPEHYKRPFMVHHYAEWGNHCWQVTDQETQLFAECESEEDAERLRDILNAAYPEVQGS